MKKAGAISHLDLICWQHSMPGTTLLSPHSLR